MKIITYDKFRELSFRIVVLQNDLIEAGLVKTHHAIHNATKEIGWEFAEIIDGTHPMVKLEEIEWKEE